MTGAAIVAGLVVVLTVLFPRWWLATIHLGILIVMLQAGSVADMALVKVMGFAGLGLVVLRTPTLAIEWQIEKWWLLFISVNAIAGVYGLAQGRSVYVIAESAWFFLQIPLYWFCGRYLLTSVALRRNLLLLGVVVIVIAPWALLRGQGGVIGATVVGGYISHFVLPIVLVGAFWARYVVQRLSYAILLGVLVLDIIAGTARRFAIAGTVSVLPIVRRAGWLQRIGMVSAIAVVGLTGFALEWDNITLQYLSGAGWRGLETELILSQMAGLEWLVGHGYGFQFIGQLPWGSQVLGPGAHSLYAAMILNTGVGGLVSFVAVVLILGKKLREAPLSPTQEAYWFLWLAWLLLAFVARPVDGFWLLGLLPAIVLHDLGYSGGRRRASQTFISKSCTRLA